MAQLAFLEQRLNERVTQGASATVYVPGRTMRRGFTGSLTQNFAAALQKLRFDVVHGIRSVDQFNDVQNAFYVVMFKHYAGLRFKHWGDYRANLNNSRATLLDGSSTVLQLQRKHAFGGVEYLRAIYKPVTGTANVFRTRAGNTSAIAAAVDYTTGLATIAGHAGGDTYGWTGEFDIPVTFTDDEWTSQLMLGSDGLLAASGSIKLEEIDLA